MAEDLVASYFGLMLAEDLMLLLIDGETGRVLASSAAVENALGGAVLLDLTNAGRVAFGAGGKKLEVVDRSPTGDSLLDKALSRLDRPVKPQRAIGWVRRDVRNDVMRQLEWRGIVELQKTKMLGIFPTTSWVIIDQDPGQQLRNDVGAVLYGEREPNERTGALISLTYAIKAVDKVVSGNRRELNARAKQISEGSWAGAAVKGAVDAVNAAVMAAITVSIAASAASSGSS